MIFLKFMGYLKIQIQKIILWYFKMVIVNTVAKYIQI
jgi:hypothetical protein